MLVPPLAAHELELDTAEVSLAVLSGALFATTAIGTWAHADPDESQAWAATWGSLGFAALGGGIMLLSRKDSSEDDASNRLGRRFQLAIGASCVAFFLTAFVVQQVLPRESPAKLELKLRGATPDERRSAVREFLVRRDNQRRIWMWVTLPYFAALGASQLYLAQYAVDGESRALLYGAGIAVLVLGLGSFLIEMLRTPDSQQFDAGARPGAW